MCWCNDSLLVSSHVGSRTSGSHFSGTGFRTVFRYGSQAPRYIAISMVLFFSAPGSSFFLFSSLYIAHANPSRQVSDRLRRCSPHPPSRRSVVKGTRARVQAKQPRAIRDRQSYGFDCRLSSLREPHAPFLRGLLQPVHFRSSCDGPWGARPSCTADSREPAMEALREPCSGEPIDQPSQWVRLSLIDTFAFDVNL